VRFWVPAVDRPARPAVTLTPGRRELFGHGMPTTQAETINADLLAFAQS
jgi:hypothetical protein